MRILFVHSIGKRKYGGGERWVINAASGLKARGHDVVVAGKKNSVLLKEAQKRNVKTYNINITSDINILQAFRLSRFIKKQKTDAVICKGRELAVTGLAVKWGGKPVLIRRSGSPPPPKSRKLAVRTKAFVDGVITNTNTIREIYLNHGFTSENFVKVIYNGLEFHDKLEAFNYTAHYPGRVIAVCIGRAVGHKGYYYLIDALCEIKNIYPHLFVYVLGEGKDRKSLIEYAKDNGVNKMIHFAGNIEQVVPYIKGADLFIHPSLYEGMPNAAMEAMAYAKPVIMTRVNGAEELSENGKYAKLIPPKDAKAIVDAFAEYMQNKDKYVEMGKAAREHVRKNFSMDNMISSLESFIQQRIKIKK